VKKQISAAAAIVALAALAACGSTPTASTAATAGEWHADSAPADTTGRVPNMMGSGN
jgi:ABC-type glycerol-3-phosphate transport system substrate-binding protein